MQRLEFTKMVASGNDFVVVALRRCRVAALKKIARKICNRKYGVGADGLLVLGESRCADLRMRIFNADGSEAEMCGNGARCVALWQVAKRKTPSAKVDIETKAGIIASEVKGNRVKIKLTDPKNLKLGLSIRLGNRNLKVNFINTGVPHTVVFVEGLNQIDVVGLGRQIRYHRRFSPAGTNVDFVEVLGDNSIGIRTYERGVEDETLACGTGSVAAALITNQKEKVKRQNTINVKTKSTEVLKVYFKRVDSKFTDVWLEGQAREVYKGAYYV